jgi:hypothetical protein
MREQVRAFFVRWWFVLLVFVIVCLVEWLLSAGANPSGAPACPWWFGVRCW